MPQTYKKFLCIIIICNLMQFCHCVNITQDLDKLKDILIDITEYVMVKVTDEQPNCVQMQCKFVCFNGRIEQIGNDIKRAQIEECPILEELCIYNYEFPDNRIYRGFLGDYGDKVKKLYIATSNVIDIQGGSFGKGIYTKLSFEKLKLTNLRKDFFENISDTFQALVVVQKDLPITSVNDDFLDTVKYKIKALTMQIGIHCVRNLTASANLLNSLQTVDFSFNDFSPGLESSTFNKLSVVEELDLSDSHISHLPANIFLETQYLSLLDLANNDLTTISSDIFGFREISRNLQIVVTNNKWDCSCQLKTEMDIIFKYQPQTKIFCSTPELYTNWSVLDNRLCNMDASVENPVGPVLPESPPIVTTTTTTTTMLTTCKTYKCQQGNNDGTVTPQSTTMDDSAVISDSTPLDRDVTQLKCYPSPMNPTVNVAQFAKKPTIEFDVATRPSLIVDVLISTEGINSTYGLIWFSKVTKEYYKMEINYNDYGLGCYGSVDVITTVKNLLPDVAYTFCLVLKDQLTISPFNCKSIHVDGNLGVSYSAWLTKDMRATGISLSVIGIVAFTFIGILMIYLILKSKPTLLKGSKRVATTNGNSSEIIVFPKSKTKEDFRQKEQMLAKRNSKSANSSCKRRNSTESIDSNQSYMNANLYEVIPAYLRFNDDQFKYKEFNDYQSTTEQLDSYILPLTTTSSADNLVRYAEIPHRAKRISNDPLPEVPRHEAPPPLPLSECPDKIDDLSVEYIITLDSEV